MKRTSLFILAILTIAAMSALGQTHGDYRSAVSGNWGTVGTWATYDTVTTSWIPATVVPTSANNVTIKTGDSVRVEASGKNCLNLTIETNAKLYTTTTSNTYVNIYGNTITNDGVMGGGTDGLSITACYTADLLFQGSGTTDISRLRPASGQTGRTINIAMDMTLHYVGASLYCNGSSSTTFNINSGKTLYFNPGSFFAYGTNSATATTGMGDAVVNIDGNMIMYNGSNFNVSVTTGNTSTVNINGMLSAGDSIMSNGTGSEVFNINPGGQLLFPNTDTLTFMDSLNFWDPSGLTLNYPITIAGKLGLMSGVIDSAHYIKMLNNSTIERNTGRLSEPPIFGNTINLVYYGAAACTTGYEVPAADSINNVIFNNPAGITLSSPLECYGTVVLESGIVDADTNYLGCMNQPSRTTGYVDGMLGMLIPTGNPSRTFHVGTTNGYSPVSISFENVTDSGGMGVTAMQSTHPNVSIPANALQRYWELGMDPGDSAVFDSCQIVFTYLAADFNTGFMEAGDEGSMTVGKYDNPDWTFPFISGRNPAGIADGGNITVSGITSFSDFTMAKDQDAILAGDTVAPYIISTYPADGDSGIALNDSVIIVFSEPIDYNSFYWTSIPDPSFTETWNANYDTVVLKLISGTYDYYTTYALACTAATDLAGNPLTGLPVSFSFTTIANQGPSITLVQQPEDTYDGTGPFLVRAVITDAAKAGIAADTLWYSDNKTDWWYLVHSSTDGDTFNYSIPGPLAAGTVIEFFFGAWDDGGAVQYDPGMYMGYQFRILDPLPPTGLAALAGDKAVSLSWNPPAEILDYSTSNVTGTFENAGDIVDTRFTPQHYPCKLEQAVSSWWYAAGSDSVELHVWGDDGAGLPDRSTDLIPPVTILPLDYTSGYTVVDLSSYDLVLSSGDFHIGYVIRTDNLPMPLCDGDGPGLRSLVFDSSASSWSNLILSGDLYRDWTHQAVVSYIAPSLKGMSLKSYVPTDGSKKMAPVASIAHKDIETILPAVYPKIDGALFLAKNITGYDVLRSDASGGPYDGLAKVNGTSHIDTMVTNGNTYYYVVRALYASPDTFSGYSNEASATPMGVEGRPQLLGYSFFLMPASPNPVRQAAEFHFGLADQTRASLEIYNVLGQRVKTLINGSLEAGNHSVKWNGCDQNGRKVSSGVYVYRLTAGDKTLTKRLTVIR